MASILATAVSMTLLSYNVRVAHEADVPTVHKWELRKDEVTSIIDNYAADIIALQEPREDQLEYIKSALGEEYSWVHKRASEAAYVETQKDVYKSEQHRETQAIGYNNRRFTLLDSGGFWLAENPELEPTPIKRAWDGSEFARVCAWAKLEEKATKKVITVLTAHFDHVGLEARKKSAHLMVETATKIAGDTPFIITGDFNTFQNDRGPEVYQAFREHDEILDIRDTTTNIEGPVATWVGWENNKFNEKAMEILAPGVPSRWDHIFVARDGIAVQKSIVDNYQFEVDYEAEKKTVYPSDHRPMIVEFSLS